MLKRALIINYHLIDDQSYHFDSFGGIYAVELSNFKRQLTILKENKIKVVSLDDLFDNSINDEFCIALTFDDANPSDFDLVYPLLKEFNYPATFFLSIHNLEKNGVSWEKYIQMKNDGFQFGSHGMSHKDLSTLSSTEVQEELNRSKQLIEAHLNSPIQYFSLPFGMYNHSVHQQAMDVGYEAILTTQFICYDPKEQKSIIHRWSVKRNTTLSEFTKIIQNNSFVIKKYTVISKIKKTILKLVGTKLLNKLYRY